MPQGLEVRVLSRAPRKVTIYRNGDFSWCFYKKDSKANHPVSENIKNRGFLKLGVGVIWKGSSEAESSRGHQEKSLLEDLFFFERSLL